MSAQHDLDRLASVNGFHVETATREELIAHLEALEDLYRAHPAQHALEELHRYLFPERYETVPVYEWHAGTIEDVARQVEQALPDAPSEHTFSRDRICDLVKDSVAGELLELRVVEDTGSQRTYLVLWRRDGSYGTHLAVLDPTHAFLICGHYDLDRVAAHVDFGKRAVQR